MCNKKRWPTGGGNFNSGRWWKRWPRPYGGGTYGNIRWPTPPRGGGSLDGKGNTM